MTDSSPRRSGAGATLSWRVDCEAIFSQGSGGTSLKEMDRLMVDLVDPDHGGNLTSMWAGFMPIAGEVQKR